MIESNHDRESSNKSTKFDDESNGRIIQLTKTHVVHNSTGIFIPRNINTIQVRDSTSAGQDGFFDPVSQNMIWVKSEAQFRNSTHVCPFIARHTFEAANIETESLI